MNAPGLAGDLAGRFGAALAGESKWVVAAGIVAAAASASLALRKPSVLPKWAPWAALVPVALGALVWAWHLKWIGDDAFISFRYAEHFGHGRGLVFNPGERVEGYTNFLWTFVLGVLVAVDVSPIASSLVLSLASYVGLLAVTQVLAKRHCPGQSPFVVSLAAVALSGSYVMACFGTSGMETMSAALLALWAVERADARRPLAAGVAGVLAVMAHPDHAILYASLGLALVMDPERRRDVVRYAVPFAVLYVPYFGWRYAYYGDLYPNTYYAKLADQSYFEQGWVFIAVCAVGMGLVGAVPVALYGAARRHRELVARYFLISTPWFLVYVAKIGGDFMLGRLLVCLVAPLFLFAELGARDLFEKRRRWATGLGALSVAALLVAALPLRILLPRERAWHVADERTFYVLRSVAPPDIDSIHFRFANMVNTFIVSKGARPRFATGSVGINAYFTMLPVIDNYGLTDKTIARLPVRERGLPGHEKRAPPGYLVSRGVDLSERGIYPHPYAKWTRWEMGVARLWLPRFNAEFMDAIGRERPFKYTDIRKTIDAYKAKGRAVQRLFCDAWFFERYYFSHNDDPGRLASLRERLASSRERFGGLETFFLGEPAEGWDRVRTFSFGADEGWKAMGDDAFEPTATDDPLPGQDLVTGNDGPFANSFHPEVGDGATGMLVSPDFALDGDVITLRVGGGRAHREVSVALFVEGRVTERTSGCATEMMGRRVWNVTEHRGKTARIEIVDHGRARGAHITVDEIVLWKRR